jgi:hypothetical protein
LANKAPQGNLRGISLVNKLREMAGWTNEITEEEWQKGAMRFPRSWTHEEFDLLRAPAREKDRQKYLAMAESHEAASEFSCDAGTTAEIILPAIKAGDKLTAQGKFDAALATYRSQLALCKTELTADPNNKTAQYNFRRAVARIGLAERSFSAATSPRHSKSQMRRLRKLQASFGLRPFARTTAHSPPTPVAPG